MKKDRPWLACGVGGLILAGVMADRAHYQVPAADSYPYHASVRAAAASMPADIGDWGSKAVEVPTGAQKLLRANVLISRQYTNKVNGVQASFLLVQCGDARDLSGHYPPVCYPNAGYTLADVIRPETAIAEFQAGSTNELTGEAPALYKAGTLYKFTQDTLEGTRAMWVFNLMVLPNGQTAPDMGAVDGIARDRKMRYFGAAEIQVITSVDLPERDRYQVTAVLLTGARPLIDAIRRGVVQ